MAEFDISLLGKRYPELNPTTFLESGDVIALYRTGQPELNRATWLEAQKSLLLINTADFIGVVPTNNYFPRWSTSLSKFVLGQVTLTDIPNLPASIITSGTFPVERIPDITIAKVTGLQTAIDGKEPVFLKGDVVSSSLTLTGNVGRLFGTGNLGVEVNTAFFASLFIPAARQMTFTSNGTVLINGLTTFVKDLNNPAQTVSLAVNIVPYVHPVGYLSQPNVTPLAGAFVISRILVTNEGHVEGITTREITKADILLGNVDNTSDLNKPISTATQTAINLLDSRFLRKDANDTNGLFTLTLNNLVVSTGLTLSGLVDEAAPSYGLVVMTTGVVRRTTIVTADQISSLQTQINGLQTQINAIVQDKNYVYVQATDAITWTVNHNLGKQCSISVYDSAGNSVRYALDPLLSTLNTSVITFITAIQGKAIFN